MQATATHDIRDLLSELQDTHELVLRTGDGDPLHSAWQAAAGDAGEAYRAWCAGPGRLRHAAYVAAEERADAALDALSTQMASTAGCPHAPRPLAA